MVELSASVDDIVADREDSGSVSCNICGGSEFSDMRGRVAVQCASCGSLERTRLLWFYLERLSLRRDAKVLHIAPERGIYDRLRDLLDPGAYRPADLSPENFRFAQDIDRIDLTRLDEEPSGHYDLIIDVHVLEHVTCNYAYTLYHLHRMLKPTGLHVCVIPILGGGYDECFQDIPEEERVRRFGQSDHVRWFGRDDIDRSLGSVMRLPSKFDATSDFSREELLRANVPEHHWVGFNASTVFRFRREDMLLQPRPSASPKASGTGRARTVANKMSSALAPALRRVRGR